MSQCTLRLNCDTIELGGLPSGEHERYVGKRGIPPVQAAEYDAIALNVLLLMHDDTLDAHADGKARKSVRTIISSVGIGAIISSIGVGIIISSIVI